LTWSLIFFLFDGNRLRKSKVYSNFAILMMILPDLIFWGFFAGYMGGLLGVGGGLVFVLIIPETARRLGIPESDIVAVTIANSLACTFFTTFAAGIKRIAADSSVRRSAGIIGLSSTVISILVLNFIVNRGLLSPFIFDAFFLLIVAYLMLRLFLKWKSVNDFSEAVPEKNDRVLWITGFFSGVLSPLSGLGGGIVVVPVLHSILHYPIRMAQSISFGVIALSTLISSLFNLFEKVDFPASTPHTGLLIHSVVLSIAGASVPGALAGAWTSGKLSSRWSGGILLAFLLFIFLRKIIILFF
jgi:uncharacterized membrane protein YfcA